MFGVLVRPSKFIFFITRLFLMLSSISAFCNIARLAAKRIQIRATSEIARNFSQLSIQPARPLNLKSHVSTPTASIFNNPEFLKLTANPAFIQVRTVTKFSLKTGKRKTVTAALKRFKRLDWGIWIRTRTGRHKKLWKKSGKLQRKLRQHVFCNAKQSWMLDKMVTSRWRKPKHYVDDPYRPFHQRENFWMTRRKPIEWDY